MGFNFGKVGKAGKNSGGFGRDMRNVGAGVVAADAWDAFRSDGKADHIGSGLIGDSVRGWKDWVAVGIGALHLFALMHSMMKGGLEGKDLDFSGFLKDFFGMSVDDDRAEKIKSQLEISNLLGAQNIENPAIQNIYSLTNGGMSREEFEKTYKRLEEYYEKGGMTSYVNAIAYRRDVEADIIEPMLSNRLIFKNMTDDEIFRIKQHMRGDSSITLSPDETAMLDMHRKAAAFVAITNMGEVNHRIETGDDSKFYHASNIDPDGNGVALTKIQIRPSTFAHIVRNMPELVKLDRENDGKEILGMVAGSEADALNMVMENMNMDSYHQKAYSLFYEKIRKNGMSPELAIGAMNEYLSSPEGVNELQAITIAEKAAVVKPLAFSGMNDMQAGEKVLENFFKYKGEMPETSRYLREKVIDGLLKFSCSDEVIRTMSEAQKIEHIGRLVKNDTDFYGIAVVSRHYFGMNSSTEKGVDMLLRHMKRGFEHHRKYAENEKIDEREMKAIQWNDQYLTAYKRTHDHTEYSEYEKALNWMTQDELGNEASVASFGAQNREVAVAPQLYGHEEKKAEKEPEMRGPKRDKFNDMMMGD